MPDQPLIQLQNLNKDYQMGDVTVHALRDLNTREIITLVPLLVFIFWIGLYPRPFFTLMAPTVDKLVAAVQAAAVAMH